MILQPSLSMGALALHGDAELAARVRMVLETRPGTLPWRPDFGCDLAALVGEPATSARMGEVRWKVEQAVRRWVPAVKVARCRVTVVPLREDDAGFAQAPLAERAVVALGTRALLEVSLELETTLGPMALHAQIAP